MTGKELNNPDSADVVVVFNRYALWYFGTDGKTPAGQYDLVSVALHELAHGLGFITLMNVAGGEGSWGGGTSYPAIYDRFVRNGSSTLLIDVSVFRNPSPALAWELTSDNIFFDGPNARAANSAQPPKLFAPAGWSASSIGHLNELAFPAGDLNSLMTPELAMAEAVHSPGPVALGVLADLGWSTITSTAANEMQTTHLSEVQILSNYPNPFNPATTVQFYLPYPTHLTLSVYNTLGERVEMLVNEDRGPGYHRVGFDGTNLASGVYFCRIQTRDIVRTIRLSLLR
jgi:hypothetical protein